MILDAGVIRGPVQVLAEQLVGAGVRLLQYRAKNVPAREMFATAAELAQVIGAKSSSIGFSLCPEGGVGHNPKLTRGATFFVNDRPDVAWLAGADGVHVGQDDLGAEQARALMGPDRWVGVSTHSLEQFEKAAATSADYIAIGPVFETSSKANPDPVVGTDMVRRVRALTNKPIVAIGGIRLERAAEVIEAGADSVAVISDICAAPDPVKRAEQFLAELDSLR